MTEQSKQSLHEAFECWWYNEGSGIIPLPGDDHETHAYRIARVAWRKGAAVVRRLDAVIAALQKKPVSFNEGSIVRGNGSGGPATPATPKPKIIPKGQSPSSSKP